MEMPWQINFAALICRLKFFFLIKKCGMAKVETQLERRVEIEIEHDYLNVYKSHNLKADLTPHPLSPNH